MVGSFIEVTEAPMRPITPADPRIEVAEILDIAVAEDGRHIDLTLRTRDENVIAMRIAQATINKALAQLSDWAALALEISAAEPVAKLNAPIGEWEIVRDVDAPTPTIECRTMHGCGLAVAFTCDPITAIPQVHVAVNL